MSDLTELIRLRAELSEAYERLEVEISKLDVLHDLVGEALTRVKVMQLKEAERLERLVGADASEEGN